MARFYATDEIRIKDVRVAFREVLARLPDDYHVCLEFQIQKDYDIVIIHNRGIHVIEVKHETNPVTGGPTAARWQVTSRDGFVSERRNYYAQATTAADALKDVLQQSSNQILLSPCSKPPCSEQRLCNTHYKFWSHSCFFPYVAIPDWNPKSQIGRSDWCWLIQGSDARATPEHVIDAVTRRNWDLYPDMRGTRLSDSEIRNFIAHLPVVPVTQSVALGEQPRWEAWLDPRVDKSLREKELAGIREDLKQDPLVAIIGEPKVGKTSAAKLLAMDLDAAGVPILDYDFRLHEPRHGALSAVMLERFLEHLKLPVQRTIQENIAIFVGALTNKRLCVIFDNFESILDERLVISDLGLSRLIDILLGSRSNLKSVVIVTATSSFSTQSGNKFPERRLLGVGHDLAVRYLSTNSTYRWSVAQAERIYGIRDGHPHVMHIASAEIKQAMQLGLTFEQAFERLSPEVVNLAFGVQYSKLGPVEKVLTEIVALDPNGMRIDAIEGVAARRGVAETILPVITRLYEKQVFSKAGSGWIKMLPQDQPYVYSRIQAKEGMHRTALDWYKQHAGTIPVTQCLAEAAQRVYELIFYHAVRAREAKAAWEALFTSTLASTLERNEKLHTLLYLCRQLRECEGFQDLSPKDRGRVFLFLGLALRQLGQLDESERSMAQAETLAADAEDVVAQAAALAELGLLNSIKGKYGRSELDYYDLALDILGDRHDIEAKTVRCRVLGRKGHALQREGADPAEVFHHLELAVQIAREIGDKSVLAVRLGTLGTAHRELGQRNFPAAIRCFREALTVSADLESDSAIVGALRGLGMTYEKSKNFPRALELYLLAFHKTKKEDVYAMVDRLGILAHVHKNLQRFEESEKYYRQALELARQIDNRKAEAENLDELGNLYRQLASRENVGEKRAELLRTAVEYTETALRIQGGFEGDPAGLANRHQEFARTLLAQGNVKDAQSHFKSAVRCARAAKRQHLEAWQFKGLGKTFEKLGRNPEMILCYAKAAELDPREMHRLRRTIAEALQAMDAEARRALELRLKSLTGEIEGLLAD